MARGNDRGRDFDDQWNESRRRGQEKAARGESHWADDKKIRDMRAESDRHRPTSGSDENCSEKAFMILGIGVAIAALLTGSAVKAEAVTPSQDACHTTNNNTPRGDCGPFKQLYAEDFGAIQVPVGGFSSCAGDGNFKCAGLRTKYPRYYTTLGAYPSGWPDTATSGADGNGGRRFGGYYRPEATTSVYKASNGDGQMRVKMTSDGKVNKVAAPVPLKCMNLRYGKFSERLIVRTATPGFKMAHLHYTPDEVDYPEAGGNFKSDPVSVFTHGFKESGKDVAPNTAWTSWHTYSTEIVPGQVRVYFDGKLVQTVKGDYPRAGEWVLQNESALAGSYAAKGASVTIDTTWLTCYKYGV